MTLATIDEHGQPWCSNLFYAFAEESYELIFTSGESTLHSRHMEQRANVAASILLESRVVGRLQGLQLRAEAQRAEAAYYREQFLKSFPYAVFSLKEMWTLKITYAKYTDNTLGFGTKLIFE